VWNAWWSHWEVKYQGTKSCLVLRLISACSGQEISKCPEQIRNPYSKFSSHGAAEGFKLGCIFSATVHYTSNRLFPLTQPQGRSKTAWKNIMSNIRTDINYHANIQFLSQINLMHKLLSPINITEGCLGHKYKTTLQSSLLTQMFIILFL
jgi:hypothetical protein